MLCVGILERPYLDILWENLFVFLGITLLAIVLISIVAMKVAYQISLLIRAMANAAQKIAEGDYSQKVDVTSNDEIGFLANRRSANWNGNLSSMRCKEMTGMSPKRHRK
jgi:signal transduction histidine kinase